MKKLFKLLIVLFILPLHLFAQDLDCRFFEWSKEWKHNGTSTVDLRIPMITSDSVGNSYFGGQFNGTLDFGNTTLSASGGFGIFIAKVDSSGQPIWAAQASSAQLGTYVINLTDIKLDAFGNTNIVGVFSGNVSFGIHALSAPFQNGYQSFFAQLNPQGQFIKAIQFGNIPVVSIDLDAMGNVYMVGSFQSTITLGSFTLSPSGFEDIFIAKMDNQGQFIWAKQFGGVGNNAGRDIAVDGVGNSYITGHFNGELTFGNTVLNNTQNACYVAKLDSNGQVVWAKHINNSNSNARNIAIDSAGNSFINGTFTDSMLINGQTLTSINFNSFVAKVNPQGEFTDAVKFWDRNNIGSNNAYYENNANYISVNSSTRSVYISSLYYDSLIVNGVTYAAQQQMPKYQVYFAELSTEKLALKWVLPSHGAAKILTSGISHDAKGNCYATGVFRNGGLILGNDTFSSNEDSRYLTKIAGLNNLVVNTNDTLTAVQTNVNYQWLDCANNMAPIPGATSRSFYPGTIGQYAVALSNDFCTDTSACLQTTAIRQLSPLEKITVYPNPASSEITLDKLPRGSAITLYDLSGRKLRSVFNKEESSVHLSVQDLAEGLYFVEIVQQGNRVFKKVVVMKRE